MTHGAEADYALAPAGAPLEADTPFPSAFVEESRQVVGTAEKKAELGFTLWRKFVELHGGRIWVKSELGRGSTFMLTLPLTIDQRGQAR